MTSTMMGVPTRAFALVAGMCVGLGWAGTAAASMDAAGSPSLGAASGTALRTANALTMGAVQDGAAGEAPAEEPKGPPLEAETGFWDAWAFNVEGGLNGATGNTERFSLRAGLNARRTTDKLDTQGRLSYVYGVDDGETSENNFLASLRNDWILAPSKWRIYAIGTAEYDDFKEWDWRVTLFGGVGYEFIKNDRTLLLGRAGAGVVREFGGSDNRIRPEGNLGLDFEHKLTERQKVSASVDWYPSFLDASEHRFIGRAGYEILVDPTVNMSLKAGIEDEYDTDPGEGFKRNDLRYFLLLVFSF